MSGAREPVNRIPSAEVLGHDTNFDLGQKGILTGSRKNYMVVWFTPPLPGTVNYLIMNALTESIRLEACLHQSKACRTATPTEGDPCASRQPAKKRTKTMTRQSFAYVLATASFAV